jgi:hypothetical protein
VCPSSAYSVGQAGGDQWCECPSTTNCTNAGTSEGGGDSDGDGKGECYHGSAFDKEVCPDCECAVVAPSVFTIIVPTVWTVWFVGSTAKVVWTTSPGSVRSTDGTVFAFGP